MNGELLAVLEYIEREKGISRHILIETVEAAIMSAARKKYKDHEAEAITAHMDPESGEISVTVDGEMVESDEFGRIAAQTAKQVIIQKIREAERSVIYEEYQERIGEIVAGGVHRFERGDIIVDLGRTEAVFPKKEQVFREEYRQGNRIRALVVDVRRESHGPQIVLSRRSPNLVRKLFELEVPEIYDSIVEIKAIAREAGDRTKIAVCSKDDKVDAVGACVGMRGTRVKNVVNELGGEKIDIIRWNDNIGEFVRSALSPAEISKITVNEAKHSVEVLVEDDMLSLAIGKKGQNVRLASKLTDWNIEIRSRRQVAEEVVIPVTEIPGVGKKMADVLAAAGFDSVKKIVDASVDALGSVPGVGKATIDRLRSGAQEILDKLTTEPEKDPFKEAAALMAAAEEAKLAETAALADEKLTAAQELPDESAAESKSDQFTEAVAKVAAEEKAKNADNDELSEDTSPADSDKRKENS